MDFNKLMAAAKANSRLNDETLKKIKKKEKDKEKFDKEAEQRRRPHKVTGSVSQTQTEARISQKPSNLSRTSVTTSKCLSTSTSKMTGHMQSTGSLQKPTTKALPKHGGIRQTSTVGDGMSSDKQPKKGKDSTVTCRFSGKTGIGVGTGHKVKNKPDVKIWTGNKDKIGTGNKESNYSSTNKQTHKEPHTLKSKHKSEVGCAGSAKQRGVSGAGPVSFGELMKLATSNKDGKRVKPPTKDSDVKQGPKGINSETIHHLTQDNSGMSNKVRRTNSNDLTRKLPSGSVTSVNSLTTSSSVTSTQSNPPKRLHVDKQKSLGKMPSVGPASVASKSFYSGRDARKPTGKPTHYSTSGSWLDHLGYSFAEMKRKRQQLQLDEEYDSFEEEEDDGFVVDDEEEEGVDVSEAIKQIFRYDKTKFAHERDCDMAMESSYSQQQFEEKRSARIGRAEDLEDLKQEEMRLSKKKNKSLKSKSKQSKFAV